MHSEPPSSDGDLIDRYMPNATDAERAAARENFERFAALVLRICTRIAHERQETIRRIREGAVESSPSDGSSS